MRSFVSIVLGLIVVVQSSALAQDETKVSNSDESTWRPLFDGKSLEGWTRANGSAIDKGWTVEEGILHRSGGGGSIYSTGEFSDFELRFTWKIAQRGNAGIKYRVQFYKKGVFGHPGQLGYEYQLYDDGKNTGTTGSTGALYALVAPPADKPLHKVGEWNDSRIVAQGTHLEHWLNGERIVQIDTDTEDWRKRIAGSKFGPIKGFATVRDGRIELQDHGHPVWFKRIEIRELNEVKEGQ